MWFKHDRDFLKRLWPTKPPAVRQQLVWLAMLAWEEQGLVEDFEYLSWLSGIPVESLQTIWPQFTAASAERDTRWMPEEMWQSLDSYSAKVEQTRSAGKTSAEHRLSGRSTDAQRTLNKRSTEKKRKEKNITTGTNVPGADAPGELSEQELPAPVETPPSPSVAFKRFVSTAFCTLLAEMDAEAPPYAPSAADVIQVEALRKRCDKGAWELTPQRLQRALVNYRDSPLGERTLADFAVRFSTFFASPLDRYGKAPKVNGSKPGATSGSESDGLTSKLKLLNEIRARCKPDSPKAPLFDAAIAALQQNNQLAYEQASQQLADLGVFI